MNLSRLTRYFPSSTKIFLLEERLARGTNKGLDIPLKDMLVIEVAIYRSRPSLTFGEACLSRQFQLTSKCELDPKTGIADYKPHLLHRDDFYVNIVDIFGGGLTCREPAEIQCSAKETI